MAPVDRREHRQQRVRGAGASTVQASFGFDFGALGAKQASLPPQRPGRRSRTPVQGTPRNLNASAKRHRSLSAPRSTKSRRSATPRNTAITPQLGKRKRGSSTIAAPDSENDQEEDELSPDRVENVDSVEKSRRLADRVSPIREEPNEGPDELSIVDEAPTTGRKPSGNVTGLLSNGTGTSGSSLRDISRRSRSTDIVPVTPGMQPHSSSRQSFVLSTTVENTASNASQAEDEDADELSPSQSTAVTPRVISRESIPNNIPHDDKDVDIDELSPVQTNASNSGTSVAASLHNEAIETPAPTRRTARGRPPVSKITLDIDSTTKSATRIPLQKSSEKAILEHESSDEQLDDLSPETERTTQAAVRLEMRGVEEADTLGERSGESEADVDPKKQTRDSTHKSKAKRTSPQARSVKGPGDKTRRKRRKLLGPRLAISVMRMKGYGVRGITMADTTRTILEEAIDHRLSRMLEKMQSSSDSARRKEMRSEINLALSFKESLCEKLLDLQDANDVLTTNMKKMRIFKRDNAELRKDILALQNSRQEIALEQDDIQAEFEGEKLRMESRNTLSSNMFDIETAIQNGREKAKRERREEEGPDVPLTMLLDAVSRDVGSVGGGLFANVRSFNGRLERAAGWLEGRS